MIGRLFSQPPALLTTTLVIAEGHAWFLRRYDRTRALQFLAMVEDMTPLVSAGMGPDEQVAATQVLRRFSDQDLTLTDAVGLHLMKARRIRICWSTDFHLGLTGVPRDQPTNMSACVPPDIDQQLSDVVLALPLMSIHVPATPPPRAEPPRCRSRLRRIDERRFATPGSVVGPVARRST